MSDELRERIVEDRLAELRGAMAGLEAPDHVKPAVMAAFRSARPRRQVHVYRWATAAAAVASVAAVLYWNAHRPNEAGKVAHRQVVEPAKVAADVLPEKPAQAVPAARKRAPRPRRHAPAQVIVAAVPASRREVATEFIALPYAPPIDANEDAQVVRVRLPRSAMRSVGLPVNEDRWMEQVPADVLLGQDGVARAVRFVKVAQ